MFYLHICILNIWVIWPAICKAEHVEKFGDPRSTPKQIDASELSASGSSRFTSGKPPVLIQGSECEQPVWTCSEKKQFEPRLRAFSRGYCASNDEVTTQAVTSCCVTRGQNESRWYQSASDTVTLQVLHNLLAGDRIPAPSKQPQSGKVLERANCRPIRSAADLRKLSGCAIRRHLPLVAKWGHC